MAIIALILAVAGGVCVVMASRGMAVLLFAAAIGLWLMPGFGTGSYGPSGFAAAAQPVAAPGAGFKGANGTRLTLEDFRGQVVLLNIWATWCAPCRSEMASLDRLQAMHGADGLEVLAVSVDREGTDKVRRFYQQSGIRNLKVYIDSDRGTQSAFRTRSIPTTVLIDRDGNIVGSMVGAAQWDSAEAQALVRRYLDN
ncbi:MAG: TlpA disulfide reductase family protein [Dongiaceae bacterium]